MAIEPISLQQFLESTPIGVTKSLEASEPFEQDDDLLQIATPPKKPLRIFEKLPRIRLFCDGECTGVRAFDSMEAPATLTLGFRGFYVAVGQDRRFFLSYICGDCKRHVKRYALALSCSEEPTASKGFPMWDLPYELCKIGEVPKPTTALNKRIKKLISADWELYRKGADDEAAGNGIGAFAYYRRVVEDSRNAIVDAICQGMKKLHASEEDIKTIENSKSFQRFSESVDELGELIPKDLYVAGVNPLTALYKPLSVGIHNKSDSECLEIAASVRVVLDAFGERLQAVLDDHDRVASALKALERFRST